VITGAAAMTRRPYVVLSCAMSLDGCLDGTGEDRLVLSGPADLDRVDAERAAADAILVGAGTIRRDDPRLLVRSASRQAERRASGRPPQPAGVTVTASGDLDPAARFFTRDPGDASAGEGGAGTGGAAASARAGGTGHGGTGDAGRGDGGRGRGGVVARRIVYAATPVLPKLSDLLDGLVEVVDGGDPPRLTAILADLAGRGVRRLMVEGGASLGTQFLTGGLVDELQLVIAPFFVGDPAAPRFAGPGNYPAGPHHPLHLAEARPVGEVVLLRYLAAAPSLPDTGDSPRPGEETAADG
jgi:5-amino-6-(5-phosphoribosylamino)uracil reductase